MKLLTQVRTAIRLRHYSRRTEKQYIWWIRRFIDFHQRRHPAELGQAEVAAFLGHLAVERRYVGPQRLLLLRQRRIAPTQVKRIVAKLVQERARPRPFR